jgi:hypothetical protein
MSVLDSIRQMAGVEVSKTLGFFPELTRLFAQENFIELSRRESFKSYTM